MKNRFSDWTQANVEILEVPPAPTTGLPRRHETDPVQYDRYGAISYFDDFGHSVAKHFATWAKVWTFPQKAEGSVMLEIVRMTPATRTEAPSGSNT